MILLTQVIRWTSKRPEKYVTLAGDHQQYAMAWGDYFFLNTNRIVDMVSTTSGGSKFLYSQAPDDNRCSPDTIECITSVADVITCADVDYPSKFVTLPIFPTNDMSRVLIDTPVNTVVALDDICMGYATPRDIALNVCHCVYYKESFKRVTCILNYSFAEIQGFLANATPLLDYDGNIYTTVRIGNQEWITTNLRTTHYADGTPIPNVTDTTLWAADVTGAYCWYDHNIAYRDVYGGLYSWYAVTNVHGLAVGQFTEGGVVSLGWRVPTMADWVALENAVGGMVVAGGELKEMGFAHWDAPNTGAVDTYGFRMMGNGNRWVDDQDPLTDSFDNMRNYSDTWSQDEHSPTDGDSVYAGTWSAVLVNWATDKFGGMAVRCLRDV